jgi:hypothetical protein
MSISRGSTRAASDNIAWGHASGNFRYVRGFGRSFHWRERQKKIHVRAYLPFPFITERGNVQCLRRGIRAEFFFSLATFMESLA